jgi:hypothetical protein
MPKLKKNNFNLKSYQYIYIGLSLAVILILICIYISPEGLKANDGLSFFGGKGWTIIPYSLAFAFYALCMWLASLKINSKDETAKYLKSLLKIMALLLIGLTITPHTIIDPIHTAFGTALFLVQLVASGWLAYKNGKNIAIYILIIIMLISGLFSAYYLPLKSGFLLQTQIFYQVAFAGILIYFLKKLK